jgi:hypothetical protein
MDASSTHAARNATVTLTSQRPAIMSTSTLCDTGCARSTVSQLPNRARSERRQLVEREVAAWHD